MLVVGAVFVITTTILYIYTGILAFTAFSLNCGDFVFCAHACRICRLQFNFCGAHKLGSKQRSASSQLVSWVG